MSTGKRTTAKNSYEETLYQTSLAGFENFLNELPADEMVS